MQLWLYSSRYAARNEGIWLQIANFPRILPVLEGESRSVISTSFWSSATNSGSGARNTQLLKDTFTALMIENLAPARSPTPLAFVWKVNGV